MVTRSNSYDRTVLCCQINSCTVLLLIVGFTYYICICHFLNWIVFYCIFTVFPYIVLGIFYLLAPILLLFGVLCSSNGLIRLVPWVMFLSLIANIVYVIMLYVDQGCLASNLDWLADGLPYHIAIATVYGFLGYIAGINFIVTLYCMLVIMDYLEECHESDICD